MKHSHRRDLGHLLSHCFSFPGRPVYFLFQIGYRDGLILYFPMCVCRRVHECAWLYLIAYISFHDVFGWPIYVQSFPEIQCLTVVNKSSLFCNFIFSYTSDSFIIKQRQHVHATLTEHHFTFYFNWFTPMSDAPNLQMTVWKLLQIMSIYSLASEGVGTCLPISC